jgi:hypothetical protein
MRIACIGWGSVVWNPGALSIRRGWFEDGPFLPVEFARVSNDKRVTLVLQRGAPEVRTLWALMAEADLTKAIENLAVREGVTGKDRLKKIAHWSKGDNYGGECVDVIDRVEDWAKNLGLDAVIWTGLNVKKFCCLYHTDLKNKVLKHIKTLNSSEFLNAATYVRKAPKQIDTNVRRHLEIELGWYPEE